MKRETAATGFWCEQCEYFENGDIEVREGCCLDCECPADCHRVAQVVIL